MWSYHLDQVAWRAVRYLTSHVCDLLQHWLHFTPAGARRVARHRQICRAHDVGGAYFLNSTDQCGTNASNSRPVTEHRTESVEDAKQQGTLTLHVDNRIVVGSVSPPTQVFKPCIAVKDVVSSCAPRAPLLRAIPSGTASLTAGPETSDFSQVTTDLGEERVGWCFTCGECFSSWVEYVKHYVMNHNISKTTVVCKLCSGRISIKAGKAHDLNHSKRFKKKNLHCKFCQAHFTRTNGLKLHLLSYHRMSGDSTAIKSCEPAVSVNAFTTTSVPMPPTVASVMQTCSAPCSKVALNPSTVPFVKTTSAAITGKSDAPRSAGINLGEPSLR